MVDLKAFTVARDHAGELRHTVESREALAHLHRAHGVYVYAQNQLSVLVEQLTSLDELSRLVKTIAQAEDEYLPGYPMSPKAARTRGSTADEGVTPGHSRGVQLGSWMRIDRCPAVRCPTC